MMERSSYCDWEEQSACIQCVAPRCTPGAEGGKGVSEQRCLQAVDMWDQDCLQMCLQFGFTACVGFCAVAKALSNS